MKKCFVKSFYMQPENDLLELSNSLNIRRLELGAAA